MKKLKIMTIFGTRPEVIKLAPVIHELEKSSNFDSVLVATGQHREMLGQALEQFDITPQYNLDIMQTDQAVSDITVTSLTGVEDLVMQEHPHLVLVHGDTTTAFAGCLAAFYHKIPVAHVEAGLRTFDKYRPFPEEINRSLITQLADLHFAPTVTAFDTLRRAGIPEEKIYITGNTVIDALFQMIDFNYRYHNPVLRKLDLTGRELIVVTAHRRENFGRPLRNICQGITELIKRFPDIEVVFSVHRNPKVKVPVREALGETGRVHLVEPLDYGDMANLLARSYIVMTDSGGIQEEAPALAKPVLVLRDRTERPEVVQAGMARIIGTGRRALVDATAQLLTNPAAYASMSQGASPYGDGLAASRIVAAIEFVNGIRDSRPAPFTSPVAAVVTGDQRVERPVSNELFYRQLNERIARAGKAHQVVSVATFDLEAVHNEQFPDAVRTITLSLRSTDTAAALDGKRLVVVLPGAGQPQARKAVDRILQHLAEPHLGRREMDPVPIGDLAGLADKVSVEIKTYDSGSKRTEIIPPGIERLQEEIA